MGTSHLGNHVNRHDRVYRLRLRPYPSSPSPHMSNDMMLVDSAYIPKTPITPLPTMLRIQPMSLLYHRHQRQQVGLPTAPCRTMSI